MVDKEQLNLIASKILIVEGKDEEKFLGSFIHHLGIDGIQILPLGGKTTTRANLSAIKGAKNFDSMVHSIGIIRDADDNCKKTFISICDALKNANFPIPTKLMEKTKSEPTVQVMVLPNNKEPGELEDLCVGALHEYSQKCINDYFTCLSACERFKSKKISISTIYAFISACEKPWVRLGESAECGYWDFNHPAFAEIVAFLRSL